jgi:hypothetical protein
MDWKNFWLWKEGPKPPESPVTLEEFFERINRMVFLTTLDSPRHFALETISLIYGRCKTHIQEEFTLHEREILLTVLLQIKEPRPVGAADLIGELSDSISGDGVRGIELHPLIIELLISIDSYLKFSKDGHPKYILDIVNCHVNCIDWLTDGIDTQDIFKTIEMVAEYERIQKLLPYSGDRINF